ncbi:MAG: hypothetical protein J7502_08510 [Flavisolibacter sp.]|nr:hypothetical protein [Flavisolibacter sp.]
MEVRIYLTPTLSTKGGEGEAAHPYPANGGTICTQPMLNWRLIIYFGTV